MTKSVRRSFTRVGRRFVHYRHAGDGPVVVMLHQSPQNSRMWLEQIAWLARDFRVLAPDLPGFGHTDPLDLPQPAIADLARDCHDWLDVLGVEHCAVFGMHTGGIVAVHMGLDRPNRVGLVMVDGYAVFNDSERALLGDAYLPPFRPDWSGQHLRWLWARMREQSFFFPWCEQEAAFALRFPAPDTARTQAAVMDILEVGDRYRLGYRAALEFAERECVAALRMPCRLFYREDDVLIGHRDRLPELPAHVHAPRLPDRPALWVAVAEALSTWCSPAGPASPPASHAGWQRPVFDTCCGEIVTWVWRPEQEATSARLLLHGLAQAPLRPGKVNAEAFDPAVLLIQPDLPGHGASREAVAPVPDLDALAEALNELCRGLAGTAALTIEAHEGSAGLALAVARRWSGNLEIIELLEPWLLDAAERAWLLDHLPDLSPKPAGGHLLEAWQWERERHLYPPWKPAVAEHRWAGPAPEVERVHANTVCLAGLGARLGVLLAVLLTPELADELLRAPCPVRLRFDRDRDDGRLGRLERALGGCQDRQPEQQQHLHTGKPQA